MVGLPIPVSFGKQRGIATVGAPLKDSTHEVHLIHRGVLFICWPQVIMIGLLEGTIACMAEVRHGMADEA
jgi:hypothetical protein